MLASSESHTQIGDVIPKPGDEHIEESEETVSSRHDKKDQATPEDLITDTEIGAQQQISDVAKPTDIKQDQEDDSRDEIEIAEGLGEQVSISDAGNGNSSYTASTDDRALPFPFTF